MRADRIDPSIVERARRGDGAALEMIVRAEAPRVERLLLRLLGPRQDLDDLMQSVFVELCRALPAYRGESALSTFVGGIAVRVARRGMKGSAWSRRRRDLDSEPPSPGSNQSAAYEAGEQLRRTRRLLEKIAPKKRVAFMLWALEGMEVEEVAELTDASVSATRSRIFYAQKELRKLAAKDPYLRELVGGGS